MAAAAQVANIPLADVQGIILRSYGMDALRVIALRIDLAADARKALGRLPLTSGSPWQQKPDFCLNLAITFGGLQALGLTDNTLGTFPEEFRQGPVTRAAIVGDTGDSAPDHWTDPFSGSDIHVLVIIYAQTAAIRDQQSAVLGGIWARAMSQVLVKDADMLPGNVAHFGYRDGFSQPAIEGGLPNPLPDPLPKAPAGEFLLGYQSQFSEFQYPVPQPNELGINGSYLALRILEQDCAAFDQLLLDAPQKFGIDGELLAAKLVGRWRNGVPLHESPNTDTPNPPLPLEKFNDYDYLDDLKGLRCPVGSHMRRNNPRSSPIAGGVGTNHRIMRRGLPYGPPFDPAHPNDGISRGLLGIFIVVSLKDQFEFLMSEWVNGSIFAPGIGGTKDPILGDNSNNSGKFVIPVAGGRPIVVTGFSRLVQTRGAAYAFLPSLSGVRYISELQDLGG
jgi:deferrochelatase/peroxidase EfeB